MEKGNWTFIAGGNGFLETGDRIMKTGKSILKDGKENWKMLEKSLL